MKMSRSLQSAGCKQLQVQPRLNTVRAYEGNVHRLKWQGKCSDEMTDSISVLQFEFAPNHRFEPSTVQTKGMLPMTKLLESPNPQKESYEAGGQDRWLTSVCLNSKPTVSSFRILIRLAKHCDSWANNLSQLHLELLVTMS